MPLKWMTTARMGVSWAFGGVRLRHPPRQVAIEPTNLCNYRCSYCPQSQPGHHEAPAGFMKLEHLDVILDKVQAAGAAWHGQISYTHDGEPFLHPQFPEFVRRAAVRGLRCRFSSNGSKLTPENLARLTDTGGDITISIDFSGSKAAFERHRSKRGDWEQIRDHLDNLIRVSNANPRVRVEVSEMSSFDIAEDANLNLQRLRSALAAPTSDRVVFFVRNFHNATGLVQLGQPARRKPRYRCCPYPWVSLNIAWNGDIHACPRDLRGRTILGNLIEAETLEEVWNGPAYQEFRRQHLNQQVDEIGACKGCDLPWSTDRQRWSWKHIYRRLQA